jgi:2'-phosphotransferase
MGVTLEEIKAVVDNNDKKRYQLVLDADQFGFENYFIRAVQGHTISSVNDSELTKPILDPFGFDEVVHGTYLKVIEPIMGTGLNKMARNHVRK